MAELGVSDEQFVEACERAAKNQLHKKIVDQIMAVDNFLAFKKLMVKRNQELNKQAMELMKRKEQTTTAPVPQPKEEQKVANPPAHSDLREVIKLAQTIEAQEEEEMMKKALAIS